MYRRVFLAFALAVALAGIASPSFAQGRYVHGGYGNVMPLHRVLPGIRNGYPGRFYDAEGPYPDAMGGLHYRIKWMMPDGRIVWLDADARTGRVIGPARDNWREGPPPPPPVGFGPPNNGQFGYGGGMRAPFPRGGFHGNWGPRGNGRPHG